MEFRLERRGAVAVLGAVLLGATIQDADAVLKVRPLGPCGFAALGGIRD
ncbi:hypothetical protein OG612_44970 (plasmid) [Streptomyces sp. NBC_01527]